MGVRGDTHLVFFNKLPIALIRNPCYYTRCKRPGAPLTRTLARFLPYTPRYTLN